MKIVVVSDSHGHTKELEAIYDRHKHEATYFIHCGDVAYVSNTDIIEPFRVVKGNCDIDDYPHTDILTAAGVRLLTTHGHMHNVKEELDELYYAALEHEATIVCYGHTHYPLVKRYKGVLFLNPGSVYANRGIRGTSYAIIDLLNQNHIDVQHYNAATFQPYKL